MINANDMFKPSGRDPKNVSLGGRRLPGFQEEED